MTEPKQQNFMGESEDLSPSFIRERRSSGTPPARARRAPQPSQTKPSGEEQGKTNDQKTRALAPVTMPSDPLRSVPRPVRSSRQNSELTPVASDSALKESPEGRNNGGHKATGQPTAVAPKARRGLAPKAEEAVETPPTNTAAADKPVEVTHARRTRRRILLAVAVILSMIVGFWLFSCWFLTVREVSVLGADGIVGVTESHVLAVVDLPVGTPMRQVDPASIDDRISESFSSLSGAAVTKKFPGKVYITLVPAVPVCRIVYNESSYVLSEELKVLFALTDGYDDLPELFLGEIVLCEEGRELELPGTYDREIVCEILAFIRDSFALEDVSSIDLTNKYSISIVYKSKYKLHFGERERMEQKARLALAAIEDPLVSQAAGAEIDVSGGIKASVKITKSGN